MTRTPLTFALLLLLAPATLAQSKWPPEVKTIHYTSPADNTEQPALFYKPPGDSPAPLLVGLHTWSSDYRQVNAPFATWCIAKNWVFIHPDFRGVNNHPEACGSELAVKDILAAVDYAKKNAHVDPDRIYLIGASGGGYMSLLMAGRAPDLWAGVSAWVPIFDLRTWHAESLARKNNYAAMMDKCCGGPPGASPAVDEEYRRRSASAYLASAKNVPLDINTGIHDGHKGSVPISHSLHAFNVLASPADQIPEDDIQRMTNDVAIPQSLKQPIEDPLYRRMPALFRRTSGNVRVTVFNGGHDMLTEAALPWLAQQKKGDPAVWRIAAAAAEVPAAAPEVGK